MTKLFQIYYQLTIVFNNIFIYLFKYKYNDIFVAIFHNNKLG